MPLCKSTWKRGSSFLWCSHKGGSECVKRGAASMSTLSRGWTCLWWVWWVNRSAVRAFVYSRLCSRGKRPWSSRTWTSSTTQEWAPPAQAASASRWFRRVCSTRTPPGTSSWGFRPFSRCQGRLLLHFDDRQHDLLPHRLDRLIRRPSRLLPSLWPFRWSPDTWTRRARWISGV